MANLSNIITPTNVLTATNTATLTNKTWNSNTIGVAYGGTGATSLTANNVLLGNGTSAVQVVAPGSSGNVLTSDGTTWASTALPAGGGLTLVSTLTPANLATTSAVTGLSSYKSFVVITNGSVTLSTTGGLQVELSANNGSTYGAGVVFTNTNGSTPRGTIQVWRTDNASSNKPYFTPSQSGSTVVNNITDVTGTINAIRLSISTAATFTGTGTIFIYGMN